MPKKLTAQELKNTIDLNVLIDSYDLEDPAWNDRVRELTKTKVDDEKLDRFYDGVGGDSNDYRNVGFSADGAIRHAGVFGAYLMGVKGMSFKQVLDLDPDSQEFKNLNTDFVKFLKENPVVNNPKGAKAWGDLFFNASAKMGEYTIPDIDYSNPEQVQGSLYELHLMKAIQFNIVQEYEKYVSVAGKDNVEKLAGGAKELEEKMSAAHALNEFSAMIDSGYDIHTIITPLKINQPSVAKKGLSSMAASRAALAAFGKMNRGKSVSQIVEQRKTKNGRGFYDETVKAMIGSYISMNPSKKASAYLTGSSNEFLEDYNKSVKQLELEARTTFNATSAMKRCAHDFADMVNAYGEQANDPTGKNDDKKALFTLTSGALDPDEIDQYLELDEDAKAVKEHIEKSFNKLFISNDVAVFHKAAGIKDPLSIIKIDGKTPGELWGEKYKDFPPEKRDFMLKAEVYNEMIAGKRDVTCDVYMIDENDEIKPAHPVDVAKSDHILGKDIAYFRGVSKLHGVLGNFKDRLCATQADTNANFTPEQGNMTHTGSESYMNMTDKLNKLMDGLKFTNARGHEGILSHEDTLQSLRELKKAARDYYKSHTGIHRIHAGWWKEGRERIAVAKAIMECSDSEISKLKDLAHGLDLKKSKDEAGARYQLKNRWESVRKCANGRGRQVQDIHAEYGSHFPSADKLIRKAEQREELRQGLRNILKGHSKGLALEEGMSSLYEGGSPLKVANDYLKKKYLTSIVKAGRGKGTHSLDDLTRYMKNGDMKKAYDEKIASMMDNEIFINKVNSDPDNALKNWEEYEKVWDDSKFKSLAASNDVYKKLAKMDPEGAREHWTVAEERLEMWKAENTHAQEEIDVIKKDLRPSGEGISPFATELTGNEAHDMEVKSNRVDAGKEYAKTLGRVLAISYANDILVTKGSDSAMEFALDANQMDKVSEYIAKGLEKDVFGANATDATINSNLNDFEELKKKAFGYVKSGVEAEKNAQKAHEENVIENDQLHAEQEPVLQ